jgi:uncharacterized membrane protein YdjX (TVP38/TMEM64 family)
MISPMPTDPPAGVSSHRTTLLRLAVFALLALVVIALSWLLRDQLTLAELSRHEATLREFIAEHPALSLAVGLAVYVAITGLSLPGATVLSLVYGWLFGFWRSLVLVSFASTTGATLAFLLSRFLFREALLRRFGERLQKFNAALEREGAFYLFTLRLVPVVPYFVVNVVMGLTPLRTWTYWWVSQLGMLPATAVFVWAGASVPSLQQLAERGTSGIVTPQLIAAFVCLGVFPLVVKRAMAWWRSSPV